MIAETVLTPADLIWPLFVTEGEGVEEPIATPARRVALVGRPASSTRAKEARDARHSLPRAVPQHAARPAQRRRARGAQPRQSDVPRDHARSRMRCPRSAC